MSRRWTNADPCPEYLAALARRALRRYHDALPTASVMEKLVWQSGEYRLFVEQAATWPWNASRRTVNIVNGILIQAILKRRSIPEAIDAARRVASRPLNTGLD